MNDRRTFSRWMPWVFAALLSVVVGIWAYNAGTAHALATAAATQGGTVPAWPYYRFHPFGFVFPFFFLFFWIFVARFFFWGGGRWRHRYGYPGAATPDAFDEWHRRAHERMKEPPQDAR